jgi:hypothetical protein
MLCKICKRPMTPLFTSYVCDYCDGLKQVGTFRGFVVLHRPLPSQEYVFRTKEDAERWRTLNRHDKAKVRPVLSEEEFRWQPSRGSIQGVMLADRLFEIFPDQKFERKPCRAYVVM